MAKQGGFFDIEERYASLSKFGDPLERLNVLIDFEHFRKPFDAVLQLSSRTKGGRPPYDTVLMMKVLVLQSLYNLFDDQMEYQIKDRLSFMRFLGLELHHSIPDAKTIWLYRERLKGKKVMRQLFDGFEKQLNTSKNPENFLQMEGMGCFL